MDVGHKPNYINLCIFSLFHLDCTIHFISIVGFDIKSPFESVILISAILKSAFSKIQFLKSLHFKIAQAFGKTC
jgi:hypothetical protein